MDEFFYCLDTSKMGNVQYLSGIENLAMKML
ncbi:hypothetical protein VSK91_21715 [Bacillus swezeyi]